MNDAAAQSDLPLVSVVVPTYNRAEYIVETIESVLQQTYPNIEIIVIDDGSTDDTAEVIRPFAPRIRYVWQDNAERGASRNHGLRLASGKYIAFLDSDDVWVASKVEAAVAFLEANPHVGLVYTDAVQIDSNGKELRLLRASGPSGRVTGKLLENNFVSIGTHMARTEVVREIGGFREERQLSGSEDWEMWVRLSLVTDFAYMPSVTAKLRTHSGNTMTNAGAMRRSMERAAELFRQSEVLAKVGRRSLRRMDANIALVNAINYCSNGDRRESIKNLRQAFSADPKIILDARFAYTLFRLLKTSR
ncbi:MAG TPA: glycosyltransferase [Sphingomicrobium sp.]|nr:glycosyltransferase [Sphingomicrobium sp.]